MRTGRTGRSRSCGRSWRSRNERDQRADPGSHPGHVLGGKGSSYPSGRHFLESPCAKERGEKSESSLGSSARPGKHALELQGGDAEMSDGFYRIPCKTCQIPFIPSSEKNVFCCRECNLNYHHPGAYKERLQFRAQMKQVVEILDGGGDLPPRPL